MLATMSWLGQDRVLFSIVTMIRARAKKVKYSPLSITVIIFPSPKTDDSRTAQEQENLDTKPELPERKKKEKKKKEKIETRDTFHHFLAAARKQWKVSVDDSILSGLETI